MRKFAALLLLFAMAATASAADSWRLIGHYSNLTWSNSADPHTKAGYAVTLYRRGSLTYGDILVANGAIEPARARLHDIRFDPRTGAVAFKARHSGDEHGRNAETLAFSGRLAPDALVGIMHATDFDSDDMVKKKMPVRIERTRDRSPWTSYAEWDAQTPK